MFAELLNVRGDGSVRDFQNFRDAAVIHLDFKNLRIRIAFWKFENVLKIRAAPRIDRLRVIAHDHHVFVIQRQHIDEISLDFVRILILIDKDELKLPSIKCRDALVLL